MIEKLYNSLLYSLSGILLAYRQEASLRIEAYTLLPLAMLSFWVADDGKTLAMLLAPIFAIFSLELINTSIEAVCDMYTMSTHDQVKIAKDCGSAAVFVAILWLVATWVLVLFV